MHLNEFIAAMDAIAPRELALGFDNPGLLVGTRRKEIHKVLVALDCTVETAREAVEFGADLLLTHHPIFLSGVKRVLPDDPETAAAYILIENGIGLFAAHTNLDAAEGGVNDALASVLCLENVDPLSPDDLGRIGTLEDTYTLGEFARLVQRKLDTPVRITGDENAPVKIVAVVGGSGGSDVRAVASAFADTFVTGEIKHHQALEARYLGLNIIAAGHYETERVVLPPLIERLQRQAHDVQYKQSTFETPCLRSVAQP